MGDTKCDRIEAAEVNVLLLGCQVFLGVYIALKLCLALMHYTFVITLFPFSLAYCNVTLSTLLPWQTGIHVQTP